MAERMKLMTQKVSAELLKQKQMQTTQKAA